MPDTKVAYCSCTDEPVWADECMRLFEVGDGITLETVGVRAVCTCQHGRRPCVKGGGRRDVSALDLAIRYWRMRQGARTL